MKHLFAALLFAAATTAALADSPAIIAAEYRQQCAQAVERLNQTLEQSAAPIAASLLKKGEAEEAQQVTRQVKDKISGEPVRAPHPALGQVFAQYDRARTKAIAALQKASIARIDALLQTPAGARLDTLEALGKLRAEIDADTPVSAEPLPPRWTYHRNASSPSMGELIFHPDGTWALIDADAKSRYGTQTGTWVQTGKDTLDLSYKGATWKMTYNSKTGSIDRPDIGKRYIQIIPPP